MISKLTAVIDPIVSCLAYISNFESLLRSAEAGPGHNGARGALALTVDDRTLDRQASPVSINNALANARRRRIIDALARGSRRIEEIAEVAGPAPLDYHLHLLESAGLVEMRDGSVEMTVNARSLAPYRPEESFDERDLAEISLVEVADISQLLPCPGDPSMFRITARIFPPPGDGIRALKTVFPRSRYSDRMKALVVPRKKMRITLYSSGNVSAVMLRSMQEAEDALYDLRDAINHSVKAANRGDCRIDHMEICHLLAHTNCGECGEKSCYCFAIKLAEGETTLEMCAPMKEFRHSAKAERLKELLSGR